MSIFKSKFKTFKSDILGEEKEFKIVNAIWVVMKDKFGLTQSEFEKRQSEEENLMGVKFVTATLIANGYEVTEQEVSENTNPWEITDFIQAHNKVLTENFTQIIEKYLPEKPKETKK